MAYYLYHTLEIIAGSNYQQQCMRAYWLITLQVTLRFDKFQCKNIALNYSFSQTKSCWSHSSTTIINDVILIEHVCVINKQHIAMHPYIVI